MAELSLADEPVTTTSPFEGPSTNFFGGAHRAKQLEDLRHLSRWSRRLLAVTGERGVGKSSLYRALSARLDPGVKAARINANLTSDTREVLNALLQGFGIASPANANPQLLAQLITVHAEEQCEARRHCLVLVDDAHLLDLRALEQLLHLVDATSEDALRVVFFAESYFITALDKATKRMSTARAWHEIRLLPFTEEDTRGYLAFRAQEAGGDQRPPFTIANLKLIYELSSGLPGRINEVAAAIQRGEIGVRDSDRWLPPMHRALALVLLTVLLGVWLVWSGYQTAPEPEVASTEESPTAAQALTLPAEIGTLAADERPGTESEVEPGTEDGEHAGAVDGAGPDLDAVAAQPSVPIDAQQPQAVGVAADTPDPVPMVESKPVQSRPERVVVASPAPAIVESPPTPVTKAVPPPAVAPVVATGPFDVEWIFDQPEGNFTLQLFGTSNRAQWQAFVDRQPAGTPIAGFESRRNGEPWFVVVYGSYATQPMADAARGNLPASLGGVDPWLRTFRAVRDSIGER